MHKTIVAILMVGAALPFAAHAADLSSDNVQYNFIQDNAPSQPAVVGDLQLGLGYFRFENDFLSQDGWVFEGAGRANIDLGMFNLELETGGSSLIFDGGSSYSAIGVAGHLWGGTDNASVGVFGAVNFPTGLTIYTAGVEGEIYMGPVTLGAEADYNWADGGAPFGYPDYWRARVWADLYATPDFRVGTEFGYSDFDTDAFGVDVAVWTATVDAEYRFSGTPFSVWAEGNYQHFDVSYVGGGCCVIVAAGDGDLWSGMIGFRVFLDGAGTTLEAHDRLVPWDGGLLDANALQTIY